MSGPTVLDAGEIWPVPRQPDANVSLLAKSGRTQPERSYGDPVAREPDEIDRAAWAQLLSELLAAANMTPEQASYETGGPVQVSWRSMRRWLTQDHGVSAARVRDVCRAFNYPIMDALVRVGFITRDEARLEREPVAVAPPLPPPLRTIADVLADRRIPEEPKRNLSAAVEAAFDLWMRMYKLKAPRERSTRDRSTSSSSK